MMKTRNSMRGRYQNLLRSKLIRRSKLRRPPVSLRLGLHVTDAKSRQKEGSSGLTATHAITSVSVRDATERIKSTFINSLESRSHIRISHLKIARNSFRKHTCFVTLVAIACLINQSQSSSVRHAQLISTRVMLSISVLNAKRLSRMSTNCQSLSQCQVKLQLRR